MTVPNLYQFATSELSQDATLAYILSWAKPDCRTISPALNDLGERLLRALVGSSARAQGIPDPLHGVAITTLDVGTQGDHIDVWAKINDTVFLLIEDKVDAAEHDEQVARYQQTAAEYKTEGGKPWVVMPVYVKTGNESGPHVRSTSACGIFLREDLLAVLSQVPGIGNTIVEEFRAHLQSRQDETESYRTRPHTEWPPRAIEGYYMALEAWIKDLQRQGVLRAKEDAEWEEVSNPARGFLGFWWHSCHLESHRCYLYLQIENGTRLQIRVSDATSETGEKIEVDAALLRRVYTLFDGYMKQPRCDGLRAAKSGRFRGGKHSALVDLRFDDSTDTYLATDNRRVLDLPATQQHLLLAMELLDKFCAESGGKPA